MGEIRPHRPVLLLLAAFSRHDEALQWGREQAERRAGPIALSSPLFAFHHTDYYQADMGGPLRKQFHAFQQLIDPADLIPWKLCTNDWEQQLAAGGRWQEPRPLNLDPGYLTEAKLVLATTKDRDHRVYLGRGIFAEVTLHYHGGAWQSRPWTYADYADGGYHQFFDRCRQYLRSRLQEEGL